jgi:Tfp pilus assembly protein PilF
VRLLGFLPYGAPSACSDAIDLDPSYSKAYMRRSTAFEALEELDNALADARKV